MIAMEAAELHKQPFLDQVVRVVVQERKPTAFRSAIPSLHIAAAVTCLILNIFLPGIGTIVASFAVFCCGNPGQSQGGKLGTFCLNFWVGVLQLLTCWIFLAGWIWSIMWGTAFISLSVDYHAPTETTAIVTTLPTEAAVAGQPLVQTHHTTFYQQGPASRMVYPPGLIPIDPPPDYTQAESKKRPFQDKDFIILPDDVKCTTLYGK